MNPGGAARPERRARALGMHLHRLGGEVLPDHVGGALARALREEVRDAPAVVREREGDGGAGQRDARIGLVAARELGRLALQELAPRGRVEVQVLDLDGGAARERRGLHRADRARFACDAPGVTIVRAPARDREPRDGADRGERFTAEPQCRRALEVFQRRDLAGGVARERERQIVALDARAVVHHLEAPHSALDEIDAHRLGAGIEAVLHQLLQSRGGPFHHLAGGDLVDQEFRQRTYEPHMGNVTLGPQFFRRARRAQGPA